MPKLENIELVAKVSANLSPIFLAEAINMFCNTVRWLPRSSLLASESFATIESNALSATPPEESSLSLSKSAASIVMLKAIITTVDVFDFQ